MTQPRPATRQFRRDLTRVQLSTVAQVARAVGTPDVDDIDGWFRSRTGPLTAAVRSGYTSAAVAAEGYLVVDASDAGVLLDPKRATIDLGKVTAGLRINGPVQFKKAIGRGMDPMVAAARMRDRIATTGGRQAMAGGRDTVARTIDLAEVIVGYRRIAQAGACDFCTMLAGRGAVYKSAGSAGVVTGRQGRPRGNARIGASYHNHCRCVVEPIYSDAPAYVVRDLSPREAAARRSAGAARLRRRAQILAERQAVRTAEANRLAARATARAGNARRRAAIEQARARALEEQRRRAVGTGRAPAELLDRYGITEEQFLNARASVKAIQSDLKEVARREADQLASWLDDNSLAQLNRPAARRQITDPITGRRRYVRDDPGYDWLEGLDEATDRQVRRRFADSTLYSPDVVADRVRLVTNQDLTDDVAMDWLIDRWLHADGLRSISSGRIPRYVDADTILPEVYGESGYSLARLFVDDLDEAAAHVAQVQAEAAEAYARRTLGTPRNGPAPWEMDAADYVAELDEVESILLESIETTGSQYRWAEARLRELAPPDLDAGDASNAYELWHRVRLVAQTARLVE